jgi:hypothetical protein
MEAQVKIHKLELSDRQVTLIRVALLQRMSRLKDGMEQRNPLHRGDAGELARDKASYDDMRAMLDTGGTLSLGALNAADVTKASIEAARNIGMGLIEDLAKG